MASSGLQGEPKEDWATEWFLGRKCHSTTSPTWATTLSGSKCKPPRPATTEWVTPVSETVLEGLGKVVLVGALETMPAAATRAVRVLMNILKCGLKKLEIVKRMCIY